MHKEIRRFNVASDEGQEYTLIYYLSLVPAPTDSDPNAMTPNKRGLKTVDGAKVNYLSKGEYKIVQTGAIVRSPAPEAP